MIRPDTIPVVPLKSTVTLAGHDIKTLFGDSLKKNASVQIVWAGNSLATISAVPGEKTHVTWSRMEHPDRNTGLRLVGPVGSLPLESSSLLKNRLVAPQRLARAWNLPERAPLVVGEIALSMPVKTGNLVRCEIDEALYLAAGRPEHARWIADLTLPETPQTSTHRENNTPHRIVTENDVWRARLQRNKITIRPGQIVTPAARSLGNEWKIFE